MHLLQRARFLPELQPRAGVSHEQPIAGGTLFQRQPTVRAYQITRTATACSNSGQSPSDPGGACVGSNSTADFKKQTLKTQPTVGPLWFTPLMIKVRPNHQPQIPCHLSGVFQIKFFVSLSDGNSRAENYPRSWKTVSRPILSQACAARFCGCACDWRRYCGAAGGHGS